MSAQLTSVLYEMGRKGDALLFQNALGGMLDPSKLYKKFRAFLKDNHLRLIRFHDLRHTFATLHIEKNQSLAYIKEQLGHSSIEITVNIYGRLVPGYSRGAADMLDD